MQIHLVPNPEGKQEWMAIELHGTISPHDGSFGGKSLGTICWGHGSNAYLIIGNQTLEGKAVKMDRPLLVIQKSKTSTSDEKNATVNAVVRRKLVFKTRPRPLVIATVVE